MTMSQPTHTEREAIHALIQQAIDAWNAGDGTAYGAIFDEDADYVNFGGVHAHGRQAIADDHQRLFDTFLRGSRLKIDITSLRLLDTDTAIVHLVSGILDHPHQHDLDPTRNSIQTLVMRRRDERWSISASQVTRMQMVQPGVNIPTAHNVAGTPTHERGLSS